MIVFTPSGKVNLAVPKLSPLDSILSFAVSMLPLMLNAGLVFSESAEGFPASEVITTLSLHLSVLESISVISIEIPFTALLKVIVVVIADSPDPGLGLTLRPSVFTPPNAEVSILGYPASQSTSVFWLTLIVMSVPEPIFVSVFSREPSVQFHGAEPQFELVHTSVSPEEAVPLSLASISAQVLPLSVDTCQCNFVVPVTE